MVALGLPLSLPLPTLVLTFPQIIHLCGAFTWTLADTSNREIFLLETQFQNIRCREITRSKPFTLQMKRRKLMEQRSLAPAPPAVA